MAYKKPHRASEDELLEARIADLEIDIKCAERDGLPEYAEECRQELLGILANEQAKSKEIA